MGTIASATSSSSNVPGTSSMLAVWVPALGAPLQLLACCADVKFVVSKNNYQASLSKLRKDAAAHTFDQEYGLGACRYVDTYNSTGCQPSHICVPESSRSSVCRGPTVPIVRNSPSPCGQENLRARELYLWRRRLLQSIPW